VDPVVRMALTASEARALSAAAGGFGSHEGPDRRRRSTTSKRSSWSDRRCSGAPNVTGERFVATQEKHGKESRRRKQLQLAAETASGVGPRDAARREYGDWLQELERQASSAIESSFHTRDTSESKEVTRIGFLCA
jgi:hypothetical protein